MTSAIAPPYFCPDIIITVQALLANTIHNREYSICQRICMSVHSVWRFTKLCHTTWSCLSGTLVLAQVLPLLVGALLYGNCKMQIPSQNKVSTLSIVSAMGILHIKIQNNFFPKIASRNKYCSYIYIYISQCAVFLLLVQLIALV